MANNLVTIKFGPRPPPAEATVRSPYPFTVYLTAYDMDYISRCPEYANYESNLPGHKIYLYSKYSNSMPHKVSTNRWSVLTPRWEFQDLSGNTVDYIITNDTPLYDEFNNFIGVSGIGQFYYIDDMPTGQYEYVLLVATLVTSAYEYSQDNTIQYEPTFANSRAIALMPYTINAQNPGKLRITKNGLDGTKGNIQSPKWVGTNIRHILTVNGNLFSDSVCVSSVYASVEPIIFSYPKNNAIGSKYPVERYIWPLDSDYLKIPLNKQSNQYWSPTTVYFQAVDDQNINIGGFIKSTVIPISTVNSYPFYLSQSPIPVVSGAALNYMNYSGGSTPLTIKFSADALDIPSTAWGWDFGDGSYVVPDIIYKNVTYTYTDYLSSMNLMTVTVSGIPSAGYSASLITSSFNILLYPILTGYGVNIVAAVSTEHELVFRDTPFVWISNPENKTINRIYYPAATIPPYPLIPSSLYNTSLNSISLIEASGAEVRSYPVPYIGEDGNWYQYHYDTMEVSGFGGIDGIAVNKCYDVWAVDGEQDYLFKFNTMGELQYRTRLSPSGCSPVSVALDKESNLWITLYGATSTIKYDYNGNNLNIAAVPPGYVPIESVDDIQYRPVGVDTDKNNNIWVSYENFYGSALIKYNTNGTYLLSCDLPPSSQPQDLVVDPIRDYCWVVNSYEMLTGFDAWALWASGSVYPGSVQLWSDSGILLSSFHGFDHPSHITIDRNLGVWFTYGYHNVGYITSGGNITTFVCSANTFSIYPCGDYSEDVYHDPLVYNETLGGICCDAKNRIWIINSLENMVYVVSADTINYDQNSFASFKIVPDDNLSFCNDGFPDENNPWYKSARAMGDWSGYRWLQKYYPYYPNTTVFSYISGCSNDFILKRFSENYDIRKFNDSFDSIDRINNYPYPYIIKDNPNLFEKYLYSMFGTASLSSDSFIRKVYERVANFNSNVTDIDVCGIDQLYSMAKELNVPIDDYNFSYPPMIKKYMDLFSISHNILWGNRCMCNLNINPNDNLCPYCNHYHKNIGNFLSNSDILSPGDKFIMKKKGTNDYILTAVPLDNILSNIITDEYLYFQYIPDICNVQVDGVIEWDSPYTTLSESASSLEEWYGVGGTIEEILGYYLRYNIFGGLNI